MAEGVGFEGANHLLKAPKEQESSVYDLPIFRDQVGIISCWRLSDEELEEVKRTGVVWLQVLGPTHYPLIISGRALVEITENGGKRPSKAEPAGLDRRT